jgi:DhnA family fructose-bisphosphate aldolase class Ia
MSVQPRLNRLLAADGKCFDVAIDHGFFGEHAFLSGIENMEQAVKTVVSAAPDAVQLTVGQAKYLQAMPGPTKPQLVLRTDVANVYGTNLPRVLFSEMIEQPVEQALRLDAACVVVNLFMLPDQPEVHRACIQNILRLKPDCERYGMPLMIEPLVMRMNSSTGGAEATASGGYMVDGTLEKIVPLVRQAVELGADVIKADPCDDPTQYAEVIRIAGNVPVLVRGGGRAPDREILERTFTIMQRGAKGIVYGRNVIQHAHPEHMTRALMSIVHDGATPDHAMRMLEGT